MKKITLLLAVLLLAGCCALLPLGGSKDVLEFVPKSANFVAIARSSAIFNDSDLSTYRSPYTSQIDTMESHTGIDFTKMDKILLFIDSKIITSPSSSSSMPYMGFILRGSINKDQILAKMRVDNTVTNFTYGNNVIYELSPTDNPESKSYFSFLDDSTLIAGSREAVQDSIDVGSGKQDSIKSNQRFSQTYDALDKNSLLILLVEVSPPMKDYINNIKGLPFNTTALSRMDFVGFSLAKQAKNLDIKLLVTAPDTVSANGISNALDKALSFAQGATQSGSALEAFVKKVKVVANGDTVTVTLSSTIDEIKQVQTESQSASSPPS
jgi:hypothetical protein